MLNSKYSNILTMLLVIFVVAILGIVGYMAYDVMNSNSVNSNAQTAVDEFQKAVTREVVGKEKKEDENKVVSNPMDELNEMLPEKTEDVVSDEPEKVYMESYQVMGTIKIPKTGIEYPVLETVTKRSLEIAVGIAYGPGLNEVGNTIIYGHNYRNGLFFSNNKKLANGDEIFITDRYGKTLTYVIYNIYQTTPNDASYFTRDTEGRREISLQTCTDDSSARIIVWAAEK